MAPPSTALPWESRFTSTVARRCYMGVGPHGYPCSYIFSFRCWSCYVCLGQALGLPRVTSSPRTPPTPPPSPPTTPFLARGASLATMGLQLSQGLASATALDLATTSNGGINAQLLSSLLTSAFAEILAKVWTFCHLWPLHKKKKRLKWQPRKWPSRGEDDSQFSFSSTCIILKHFHFKVWHPTCSCLSWRAGVGQTGGEFGHRHQQWDFLSNAISWTALLNPLHPANVCLAFRGSWITQGSDGKCPGVTASICSPSLHCKFPLWTFEGLKDRK